MAPTTTKATTTTVRSTTAAPVSAGEDCEGSGAPFTTSPGVTCEEVYEQAKLILLTFDGFEKTTDFFIETTSGIVCGAMAGTEPKTYEPESTYIPALADALVDRFCPGDREMLVLNS